MVEIEVPKSVYGLVRARKMNQLIGNIGEKCMEYYFEEEGFRVIGGLGALPRKEQISVPLIAGGSFPAPFDFLLVKQGKHCIIDVKSTSKNEWQKKEYFKNHERYKKQFGHEFIDEYLRLKIDFKISISVNDEDLEKIMEYFEDKKPKYDKQNIPSKFFEKKMIQKELG